MSDSEDDAPGDIPAWFMTYSDVITLLMTFFILLLTFSTTEPEKFERVSSNMSGAASATGILGAVHTHMDHDSWTERVRPRSARIAMDGSEIPPMQKHDESKGAGLQGPTEEEAKIDAMRCHELLIKIERLSKDNTSLTEWGQRFLLELSGQLRSLPVHCSIQFSSRGGSETAIVMAELLTQQLGVRPGHVALSYSSNVESDMIQIVIERYEENKDG